MAPESNNTQDGFEFKKRVPVNTILEVAASVLLITYTLPMAAGFGDGGPWQNGVKGFIAPFSMTFSLQGQVGMGCSGLPNHLHLLVPTGHSGVVELVLPHFLQDFAGPMR